MWCLACFFLAPLYDVIASIINHCLTGSVDNGDSFPKRKAERGAEDWVNKMYPFQTWCHILKNKILTPGISNFIIISELIFLLMQQSHYCLWKRINTAEQILLPPLLGNTLLLVNTYSCIFFQWNHNITILIALFLLIYHLPTESLRKIEYRI